METPNTEVRSQVMTKITDMATQEEKKKGFQSKKGEIDTTKTYSELSPAEKAAGLEAIYVAMGLCKSEEEE